MSTVTTTFFLTINASADEVFFSDSISYGSRGGAGFNTAIVTTQSGAEQRTARWDDPLRRYNASFGIRSHDDLNIVQEFFLARKGALRPFRFKDWGDYASTTNGRTNVELNNVISATDQSIGTGDAIQTEFQLVKRYVSGPDVKVRNITKPRSGLVKVAFDGVEQFSGWSLDTTTGKVLFTLPPADGVVLTAGFEFDVFCRFDKAADNLLNITWVSFDSASAEIPIVEIRDALPSEAEFMYGGGKTFVIAADFRISLATGRVLRIDSEAVPNLEVIMPLVDDLVAGGPYFYIENGGTLNLRIVPEQGIAPGGEITDLAAGEILTVLLVDDAGTLEWIGIK